MLILKEHTEPKIVAKRAAAFIEALDAFHSSSIMMSKDMYALRDAAQQIAYESGYILTYDGGNTLKYFVKGGEKGQLYEADQLSRNQIFIKQ